MYGISYVMCKGPGRGLSLGVERHGDRCALTISGYQGQGNETHYLSSVAGHPSYNGSLAVKTSLEDSCYLTIEQLYVPYELVCHLPSDVRKGFIQGFVELSPCGPGQDIT